MTEEDLISPELGKDIPQIELQWDDVYFNVRNKTSTVEVLKGVSGCASPGEFLAIMGSSGAGKTTLLNILSNRVQKTKFISYSGDVRANNLLITDINFKSYIGYVTQEDILIECLTVKECLLFSALLRLKSTRKQIESKVDTLIKDLMLEKCQNTFIGGGMVKGVSGGERKRTCIGIELVTEPSILFLDEPTSGLDSFTAAIVVKLLLTQAKKGRTVIATIHQPNSETFAMFDKLLLMSDGHIVYHGYSSECIEFFDKCGFACPPLSNPADFFIEVLHIKRPHELDEEEKSTLEKLLKGFKAERVIRNKSLMGVCDLEKRDLGRSSNFFYQTYMNTVRFLKRMVRNPGLFFLKLFIMAFNSIIINIFYYDVSSHGATGYRDTNGIVYFVTMNLIFSNLQGNLLSFPLIRSLMIKEYNSNMYGVPSLLLAKTLTDGVNDLITLIFFGNLIYWSVGLTNSDFSHVLYFFCQGFFINMAGGALGMLCGAIFRSPETAMSFSSIAILPQLYFSGFYRSKNIPDAFKWLENLSVVKYGFQGLVKNQWDGVGNPEICLDGHCERALDLLDISMSRMHSMGYLVLIMIAIRILCGLVLEVLVRKNKS